MTKANRPGTNEFMVADCLADLTDDENAAAAYSRVGTLMPERPEGWMGVCRLALLQGNFATATREDAEAATQRAQHDFAISSRMGGLSNRVYATPAQKCYLGCQNDVLSGLLRGNAWPRPARGNVYA